ncbi:YncE family protein [Glaciecola sp. MH2013]|uniref:YncE family protein n=1 Tax=Glaciecola sp. MH2013 TaxID=2785524 RepID=UPI0018A02E33|nr:YncE family protein [Glaciecola sp. MH2013]MBF7073452.1 YncE family protein [Glaciecola sp. MH2013]
MFKTNQIISPIAPPKVKITSRICHSLLACMIVLVSLGNATHANTSANESEKAQALTKDDIKGLLVVVNKSDNSVSVIDTQQQKIVNTLPTGKGPHELVASSDGKIAVSTDFVGGDSLTVFNITEQKVERSISLEKYPGPHGIQFLKEDKSVAFTSGKSAKLVVANIISGEIEAAIPTQQQTSHMAAIDHGKGLAYVSNIRSNSISKTSLENKRVLKQIKVEEMPEAIRLLKDGSELWYGANKEGLVVVIDPETEAKLAVFDGFSFPYRVLFSHSEKVALVPDFRHHDLRFFDVANKTEIGRLALEKDAGPQGITLHPSLDIAFLSLNLKNKIVAIDIHSQRIIAEYPTGNNPDGIVFINANN